MSEEDKNIRREEIRRAKIETKEIERRQREESKKKERAGLEEKVKKNKGWFQKIPTSVLLSPGGMVLILFAGIIEVIDPLLFIPVIDQIIEIPLEIIFVGFYMTIVPNASFKSLVLPLIIERFDILGIIPTFFLKMFI